MMRFPILAICCGMLTSAYAAVAFKDCSKGGKVQSIAVSDCTNSPCELKKGTNATVTINFMPDADHSAVEAKAYGIIGGAKVELPGGMPNPDGCKDSGLSCPIKAGSSASYHSYIFVSKLYPSLSLVVEFDLTDGDSFICFTTPCKVTSSKKQLVEEREKAIPIKVQDGLIH